MGYRLKVEQGRHCIHWRLAAVWLAALPLSAWAQSTPDNGATAPKPVAAQPVPPKKINLYRGQAEELLSDTRWKNLLAMQPAPEPEAVSDSRDWSNAGDPVTVKVEGTKTQPEVPGGIASLFWALRHPTQAWRIFAPAR
jgi:hypothetical protein